MTPEALDTLKGRAVKGAGGIVISIAVAAGGWLVAQERRLASAEVNIRTLVASQLRTERALETWGSKLDMKLDTQSRDFLSFASSIYEKIGDLRLANHAKRRMDEVEDDARKATGPAPTVVPETAPKPEGKVK